MVGENNIRDSEKLMMVDLHNKSILVSRLKKEKNGVTFLLGSAFSQITNGAGIPNVDEVLKFIEDFANENGLLDEYCKVSQTFSPQDRYQKSFSLIAGLCGQDAINEIIRRVVESNFDEDGKQQIPQAVKDFVSSVKNKNLHVKNIITTNFDTLLEEEFTNQGIHFNSFSIVADTQLDDEINSNINIIHLHGIWDRGDSMHTTSQLNSVRDRTETSLQELISKQTIAILGYSGWDDSFTRSLASTVINNKSNYNLLWCFFEANDAVIEKYQIALFNKLKDAITRGRISFFKGIDCNDVFKELSAVTELKKKEMLKKS
ncbi:SIR2 family protein [Pseudoalteromonas sp. SG43-1]|uniref:SIR2 family protein n=1 Tax=Pseudoalteromonas sp. SG43-1 TaxID=2760971 RepID=UPI001C719584|nr:SIR2 family protein [Pseudoalteromonas sp. SG43-1]